MEPEHSDHRGFTYAQEFGGQKLHVVEKFADGCVANRALCGRSPISRGAWRMTINVPMKRACKRCVRVARW